MTYKIACLTPIKHINGAWQSLSEIGTIEYAPDTIYKLACAMCQENNIVLVNPNKMKYRLDEELIKNSNLKYIVTASTGTNHIDKIAAKRKSIKIISLTKEMKTLKNISSTAEHALGLTLALIRNIPSSFDSVKSYKWNYEPFIGRQISHLTVGVVGCGRLGKMYAKYMKPLAKKVVYTDPYVKGGIELNDLLNQSDIISLHVHLTDETTHMVNKDFLEKCAKKPYIINTSRGSIVNETDIIKALHEKKIAGYATDVIEDELKENCISTLVCEAKNGSNIIITPHIGGMTIEAQEIAYNAAINLLKKEINGKI